MHDWNLQYVLTVAEERSISKAARKLYASQPALSLSIQKLEKELGVLLFDRTTLPLRLTYAGERFVATASQIVDLEAQLLREIEDINNCSKGRLVLGISRLRGKSVLPTVLPVYKERFPGIDIVLMEQTSSPLEELAISQKTDLTITNLPLRHNQLEYTPICMDEILVAVPDKYLPTQFDRRKYRSPNNTAPEVDLYPFKDSPFILLKPGMRIRQVSEGLFKDEDIKPNIILDSENIETLFELAVKGMGVTLIHQSFIPRTSKGTFTKEHLPVSFLRLKNPKAKTVLVAAYLKERYLSKAAREFIILTKQLLSSDKDV